MSDMGKTVPAGRRGWFMRGLRDGIPISMGYFAVAFTLGITAKNAGLSALESGVMSLTMLASAGQYAAMTVIGAGSSPAVMILTTIIVNLRYLLMSTALSQKLKKGEKFIHRLLLAYCVTDEIFAVSAAVPGSLCPFYTYGVTLVAAPGWTAGTVLGVLVGTILPVRASNAMSVALYGMFLAVVIPPAKRDRFIGGVVLCSMAASALFAALPLVREISSGMRIIILTLIIASAAALLRPVDPEKEGEQ